MAINNAATAPASELDLARRGTAYFARLLNDLPDSALDLPSTVEGFSRRRLIAYVSYQARLLGEVLSWARSSTAAPFPREAKVSTEDLEFGIVQPSHALRHLFHHAAVHLNVEWRDMTESDWDRSVVDASGQILSLRETPLLRARTLWTHAVRLNTNGRMSDVTLNLRVPSPPRIP